MSILNSASVLGAVSGLGQVAGKGSPALGQFAPYAGIAAQALGKVADALPGLAEKAENFIGKLEQKLDGMSAAQLGLYPSSPSAPVSTRSALRLAQQLDANHDGILSKDELQNGLQQLSTQISQQKNRLANNVNTGDAGVEAFQLRQLVGMQQLGQKLLNSYDGIAQLDHQAGVSMADIKLMAFQDNNPAMISAREFLQLANSTIANI